MAAFVERVRCPLCSSGALTTLRSIDFGHPSVWRYIEHRYEGRARRRELAGRLHEIARCDLCELFFPRFVLSEGARERLYGEWLPASTSEAAASVDLGPLERHTGSDPRRSCVLDLSGGNGEWSLAALERGFEVIAIEVSDTKRKHLRELGVDCRASLDDVPRASIDFAHCDRAFERTLRPVETLRMLAGRLVPGGVARIEAEDARPAAKAVTAPYWSASDDALRPLENVNAFTARALRSLGRAAQLLEVTLPRRFAVGMRRRAPIAIELGRVRS